ncbi:hypothetical protein MMC26_007195 [Xylographa opegraphella]|nr:hypothetical protein [Xylographa opegraphella]
MVCIPYFNNELNFDLFDTLGLNPTNYNITEADIRAAWPHVCKHLDPKIIHRNYPNVPVFPTFTQAQRALDWFLVQDFLGSPFPNTIEVRIRIALCEGRADFKSTWNPFALPGNVAAVHPIPAHWQAPVTSTDVSRVRTPSRAIALNSNGNPSRTSTNSRKSRTSGLTNLAVPHDARLPDAALPYNLHPQWFTHDGSTHDGSTNDGSTYDNSTHDDPTHDGSTHDGSTHDGCTHEGSTQDCGDGSAKQQSHVWPGDPPEAPPGVHRVSVVNEEAKNEDAEMKDVDVEEVEREDMEMENG